MKINIGTEIDLVKLIDTRLLIQANSGGGKSYAIRKLLEETNGKVQQIVLDLEGEFGTLREKYNFVLIGKEGDLQIDIKHAATLCHKLLEHNINAIIDLYEFKHHERILFVKRFLDAMVNAPKELWHQVLMVVDEAHMFAPEKSKAESLSSVIDLCTRGRKRGFCAVLATQRLSKLHKDAAAECNNKLIGRTGLDVDMKRAAEELGFTSKDDMLKLRSLEAGEFFTFGPAISTEIEKIKIRKVHTTHPQAGKRIDYMPPPSDKIKQVINKLSDLPQEAEKELSTAADLKKEVTRLRSELTRSQKGNVQIDTSKYILKDQVEKLISQAESKLVNQFKDYRNRITKLLNKIVMDYKTAFSKIGETLDKLKEIGLELNIPEPDKIKMPEIDIQIPVPKVKPVRIVSNENTSNPESLGRCEREILNFLATYPDRSWSKVQVGVYTGYSFKSGGFNNAISKLNSSGLIERDAGNIRISSAGISEANVTATEYDKTTFINKLGKCEREIYQLLLDQPYDEFSKADIGERTGYSATSGGFNNAISRLNTLGLIERRNGMIKLNPELNEL